MVPSISRYWGQYTPYFAVGGDDLGGISSDVPAQCNITFAQVLSRHGARDPTAGKTVLYGGTIEKLKSNVQYFHGKYAFLNDYQYTLGADQLNTFGARQLLNSGIKFYERYRDLTRDGSLFVRTAGQQRVVESASNFTQGYHDAKLGDGQRDATYPYNMVVIEEGHEFNNTLSHGLCTQFREGLEAHIADDAKSKWASIFVPPIQKRFNSDMPGANLSIDDILHIMQICPFETVASDLGTISPFCNLLTEDEWHQYNHYESLEKFYRFGNGNPLGPTQGVGFANELLARMLNEPVRDHTSTNSTLDNDPATFPIGREHKLFADFSHDNDLTGVFFALGLYDITPQLRNDTTQTIEETKGWSSAWSVPFASRAYFEKMRCEGYGEELVRVIINDRVLPLEMCGGDELGRCLLGSFSDAMGFVRKGGHWDRCFRP
ncbi:MAG: hypothetical protein M1828_001279 [Chrysothrix sp. TS-e1954]|nr:MAG: hypothetical protein M1828_001279 [Chrysothrix sp. TS-e1954]